jgi:hypothetical protein
MVALFDGATSQFKKKSLKTVHENFVRSGFKVRVHTLVTSSQII